jgi:hypothetical protein
MGVSHDAAFPRAQCSPQTGGQNMICLERRVEMRKQQIAKCRDFGCLDQACRYLKSYKVVGSDELKR